MKRDYALPQNTFLHLGSHTRVHLHSHDLAACWKDTDSQISRTWTDLEHDISGFEVGLVDDTSVSTWLPSF